MSEKKFKKQELHEGAAVLLLATAIVKIIGAFFKIPLSSDYCLGDLGFGYFSTAYDFFGPISTVTVSGFPVVISRIIADFTAKKRFKDAKNAFNLSKKLIITLGFCLTVLMIAFSFPFVKLTDSTCKSIYSLLALAPSFFFCFWSSVYRGYFEGYHNMTYPAVSNVIEALGKLFLGLGLALITVNLTNNPALAAGAALLGITVGDIAGACYLRFMYKNKISATPREQTEEALTGKELIKLIFAISLPTVLSAMSGSMVSLIDVITVRWQLNSYSISDLNEVYGLLFKNSVLKNVSTGELPTFLYGTRSKAYTIYNLVPSITVALGVSSIPALTEAFSKNEMKETGKNAGSVIKLSALITLPIAAGFIAVGKELMALLYGRDISSQLGGVMLSLYGIAVIFSGIFIPLSCVLQALGKQNTALYNVAVGLIIKIVLNLWLCSMPKINIFGAVISTVACNFIIFILHFVTLIRCIGFSFNLKNTIIKPLISALFCGLTAATVSLLGESSLISLLSVCAAAVVYIIVAAVINTFEETDILSLPMGKKLLNVCRKLKIVR